MQERACPRTRSTSPNPRHRHAAFAGKRAPTPVRCQPTFPGEPQICVSRHFQARPKSASADISQARRQTCRSRLAGERGISAEIPGTDPSPSRASALLHRFGVSRHFRVNPKFASADISKPDPNLPPPKFSQARRKTCRSRLAGEPVVSAQTHGTDTPPSRASALLHRFCVSRHFRVNPKSASAEISKPAARPEGAGLLANAVSQPKSKAQAHRLRGQSRSCSVPSLNRGLAVTPPAFRR